MFKKIRTQLNRGFTLIELMIVIAIIGILASIAIPQFMKFQEIHKKKIAIESVQKQNPDIKQTEPKDNKEFKKL